MGLQGTTTIASGRISLSNLIKDIDANNLDYNEAETRFHIIDRIIRDCLGWPEQAFRLEQSQGRSYSDYELGKPRRVIWEAKKEGRLFQLPANPDRKLLGDLPSIIALGGEAADAIKQVQNYCSSRGVDVAIATNGHQLVAFIATRDDGIAPLEGAALIVESYRHFHENFPQLWQLLSPAGVAERRLHRFLTVGEDKALPPKLATSLSNYPQYRYPSELQSTLRDLSELLIIDAVEQPDLEKQFYTECYCESGALSQHALISKSMLSARYSAMFDPTQKGPAVAPVRVAAKKAILTPEVATEASSQRPIVLIGDVGVGKTSFLKHLIYVSAYEEFKNAVYLYIDLGSRGALNKDLVEFVLSEIEDQLLNSYDVDVHESSFVKGVYNLEISRFRKGIYGSLEQTNPTLFEEKLLGLLAEKSGQRDRHLREAVNHLALGRKKQVVIVIDNADQRNSEVQQDAFIIAQSLAKEWKATVFIAVQPKTFYASKQSGALKSYPNRVFTISPPRIDAVIVKRLTFALSMAEGKVPVTILHNIELRLENITLFLRALLFSLEKNESLVEFMANITGGNIRAAIDFVTKFIGSANVESEKIIDIMISEGRYIVPVHEFWKEALLGQFSYYDPQSSMALNLFDVRSGSTDEHFLLPIAISFLEHDGRHRNKEGFVVTSLLVDELQRWGFLPGSIEDALRRANNKKLIEAAERITFAEDENELIGAMPSNFRISTIGAYHVSRWLGEFAYLDAMSYDTPIINLDFRQKIASKIQSFAIADRYERANDFRAYLTTCWRESKLRPAYFDWETARVAGDGSFQRVTRAIERNERSVRGR
ncbi:AAA family ATPase [Methylobacterium sp. WCS2018Hpa-22]|uniref:AAA family ATPase n=1 Tax=Methylobacterium sp. WCS2018Hpa-22 TaxID=3073633 RepID=UPI00288A313D|nr:AAA family ATPase [Methylobacterium sp. WCS2018Hpa-22]